jgi:hypothetical protein
MTAPQVFRAADAIARAMRNHSSNPMLLAEALQSAQLLQSPETAAELERLRARVVELETAAYGDAKVRLLTPVEQIRHLHAAVAAQLARAGTLDRLLRKAQARVAELEVDLAAKAQDAEAAVKGWGRARDRVTELEVAAVEGRAALAALCHDLDDPGSMALGALYLLQQATPGTPMEPGETVPKAYQASHDSIVMGLYLTPAAARAHCEAEERHSWPTGTSLAFDWIEDEDDGVAELVVTAGQNEESTTGYVVTALEVASEYDEEADEC